MKSFAGEQPPTIEQARVGSVVEYARRNAAALGGRDLAHKHGLMKAMAEGDNIGNC